MAEIEALIRIYDNESSGITSPAFRREIAESFLDPTNRRARFPVVPPKPRRKTGTAYRSGLTSTPSRVTVEIFFQFFTASGVMDSTFMSPPPSIPKFSAS